MKKLVLSSIIIAGSLFAKSANAQVGVHVGFNIGPISVNLTKPVYTDYYYLPDAEAYYSVPEHVYYFMDGGRWVSAAYLPGRFHDMDWRTSRRYHVNAQRPYMNHMEYRKQYGGYPGDDRGRRDDRRNDQYAYRGPQGNDRRFPDSPYDSNNEGRGGYQGGRNDNRYGDRGDNRNNDYNRGNRNDDRRGNDNNAPRGGYQPPIFDNQPRNNGGQQPGRDNSGRGNQNGGYSQPTNNGGQQPGNGGYNRGNNGQSQGSGNGQNSGGSQNSSSSSRGGNRQDRGNSPRAQQHFAGNNDQPNSFSQRVRF